MVDAAALDVHLHPLVLINISDHVVRFRATGDARRVLGAVIGAQEGRRIDVHNSFELVMSEDDDGVLDMEFFKQRLSQYLEVFPRYEFLGWYSTGKAPLESDKALNKKLQEATSNDSPFCVLLDTDDMGAGGERSQSEDLPVKVFDFIAQVSGGETLITWHNTPYVIDTLEAERIAVSHVTKSATTAASGHTSDFTQHAGGLANSVAMLSSRVKELLEHAKEMKAGRAPKNRETMRQLLSICQTLQANHPDALRREFCAEFNDAALVVLLASLSKTCANTSDLLDKVQLSNDKKHRQRPHYPLG
eukprot:TRINITY_DN43189_c0_g1_i1.p1 TRINITY_DN43189_c0_g1~~TRINITY_DN43189_c0_g1_i1.p1  ORF type:complete len:343 (-),score=70.79 TRINITY_DN43189_c0_g1_i1:158-1069(-)